MSKQHRRKTLIILSVIVLVLLILLEFNFAHGIDFRLRKTFKSWNKSADSAAYFEDDGLLYMDGEQYNFRDSRSVDVDGSKVYLAQCEFICADGDEVYFMNYYGNHFELMSYNTADGSYQSYFEKSFERYAYTLVYAEGIMPGFETPFESYFEVYGGYDYAICFCYDKEIVIQNGSEADIFNIADGTLTTISGSYCPKGMSDGISLTGQSISISNSNGEVKTMTLRDMAELDKTANEIYKMSLHKTAVFGPKITVQFLRAGYYEGGIYIAMVLMDSGGWPHLVYYRYQPESNELTFLRWWDILDYAHKDRVHIVPKV